MANSSSPDYKELFLRAEEERQWEAELMKQAEEQIRKTTFAELIQYCHDYFSRPLRVESPSHSTTGKLPPPKGKCCPLQLLPWTNCAARQQEVYRSVCTYLAPSQQPAARLFPSRNFLEGLGEEFRNRAISSDLDLESYERFGVENRVHGIIMELCKIPAAREEFHLGDGVRFDNHVNALCVVEADQFQTDELPSFRRSRPDQYCIHRVDSDDNTILTTVQYKPPYKLSVENLRAGLRPMKLWDEIVRPGSIPTEEREKLKFNAALLTGTAVVQEYHVMLQEGLEYSYLTNGLALVLLWLPYNNPSTLYYHLCEPNREVDQKGNLDLLQQPLTAVAHILCLCLMSFRSRYRDQEWRNNAQKGPKWMTSFDHTRSQIPESELRQNPPDSERASSESTSSEHTSPEYLPSRASYAPPHVTPYYNSLDSDADQAPGGRKRGFSQVTSSPSSPSAQRSARQAGSRHTQSSGQGQQHVAEFCTQKCLRSLQQGGQLDDNCPNVMLHRQGGNGSQHPIDAATLIQQLKHQLDENIDRDCTPLGGCGASGVPFKVTCTAYGYTVIGKGTTVERWDEVKREREVYRVLQQVQGSAVPVFLGTIDLAKFYFVHGAGEIRHMLIMAWGGNPIRTIEHNKTIAQEIKRSKKKIRSLGVLHHDLRSDNILWNAELGRALIIDFHCSELNYRPMKRRARLRGKHPCGAEAREPKRLRAV